MFNTDNNSIGKRKISAAIAACMLAAGCAIHPLPEDFADDPTNVIVKKVRCEIQEALFTQLIRILTDSRVNKETRALGKFLQSHPEFVEHLGSGGLPAPAPIVGGEKISTPIGYGAVAGKPIDEVALEIIQDHLDATIAYEFRFEITEDNNNVADASFRVPFSNGSFSLGLKAGNEHKRVARRIVKAGDTFESFQALKCSDEEIAKSENWIYPITGKIGMAEVFETYIDLASQMNSGEGSGATDFDSLTDTLTFTSKFVASAKPELTLMPGFLGAFKLASAKSDNSRDRTDIHEVKFTISPPVPEVDTEIQKIPLGDGVVLNVTTLVRPAPPGAAQTGSSSDGSKIRPKGPNLVRPKSEAQKRRDLQRARYKLDETISLERGRRFIQEFE